MVKKALKYIIPSIITSILGGIYVIVDGFFVGNKLGDIGLAALNIAWPITAFIQAVGLGIGLSCGIYLSFAQGKNDTKEEKRILKSTYGLLFLFAILSLFLLIFLNPLLKMLGTNSETHQYAKDYIKIILYGSLFQVFGQALVPIIRNYGKIKWVTISMIVATLTNFLGDYLFIYVFDMELTGAAIASIFGQAMTATVGFGVLLKNRKIFIGKPNLNVIMKLIETGIAPFILTFSSSFLIIIYNLQCLKYGGNMAVACYTVFAYLLYIVCVSAQGVGDGIQPLISYYQSKNDTLNVHKLVHIGFIVQILFVILINVIFIILKKEVAQGFSLTGDTKTMFYHGYKYFIIGFFFISIIRMSTCYLYATESTIPANITVILEPLIISPILLILLPKWFKLDGVWMCYTISQISVSIVAFYLFLMKYFKHRKLISENKEIKM